MNPNAVALMLAQEHALDQLDLPLDQAHEWIMAHWREFLDQAQADRVARHRWGQLRQEAAELAASAPNLDPERN